MPKTFLYYIIYIHDVSKQLLFLDLKSDKNPLVCMGISVAVCYRVERGEIKMSEQIENANMAEMINSVHNDIMGHIGINDAQLKKLITLSQEEFLLGGTKDITFKLPIKNGKGHQSVSQTTAWVTISGDFEITSPDEGTWDIVVKDGKDTILNKSDVKKDQKISFKHKTGFTVNISLDATWSESKDTTLVAKIHASY